jgi:hypothetical protein
MSPSSSTDAMNIRPSNRVPTSDAFVSFSKLSCLTYFYYVCLCYFTKIALFTINSCIVYLLIVHILLLSARIKMVGVYAKLIVTLMEYKQSVWNFPFVVGVRGAVSRSISLLPVLRIAGFAVPVSANTSSPKPASIGLLDAVTLKSYVHRDMLRRHKLLQIRGESHLNIAPLGGGIFTFDAGGYF